MNDLRRWMRLCEDSDGRPLNENWHSTVRLAQYYSKPTDVDLFVNPSKRELKEVVGRDRYARAFLSRDNNLYVWDGDILHDVMRPHIPLPDIHLLLENDQVLMLHIDWHREKDKYDHALLADIRRVQTNPALLRLYGQGFKIIGNDDEDDEYFAITPRWIKDNVLTVGAAS